MQAQLGMLDDARASLERLAQASFADVKHDGSWLITMCVLAEVCFMIGDQERAAIIYPMLVPHRRLHAVAGSGWEYTGSAAHFLGLLATTLYDWAAADAHFTEALSAHESVDSPLFAARTQYCHARMLLARGRNQDEDRSNALLEGASRTADRLDLADLNQRITRLQEGNP